MRQRASELLRLAEGGETIEITDRGRPVAVLAPLPDRGPLARLRSAGDVRPATDDDDELPEPLPLAAGQEAASVTLARFELIRINDRVLNTAETLLPAELRSLDAIHLATACLLGTDLAQLVTYDERMAAAARSMEWTVAAPS